MSNCLWLETATSAHEPYLMMVEGDPRRGKWMACFVGYRSDVVQCLGCSSCERPCLQPWSVVEPQLQLARLGQSQSSRLLPRWIHKSSSHRMWKRRSSEMPSERRWRVREGHRELSEKPTRRRAVVT